MISKLIWDRRNRPGPGDQSYVIRAQLIGPMGRLLVNGEWTESGCTICPVKCAISGPADSLEVARSRDAESDKDYCGLVPSLDDKSPTATACRSCSLLPASEDVIQREVCPLHIYIRSKTPISLRLPFYLSLSYMREESDHTVRTQRYFSGSQGSGVGYCMHVTPGLPPGMQQWFWGFSPASFASPTLFQPRR